MDGLLCVRPFLRGKDAGSGRELRSLDFSTHGARRNLTLGVVADAFVFTRVAARHNVKFAVVLAEPDWSRYAMPLLRKVVRQMYFWPWISGGMGLLMRVFYSSSTKALIQATVLAVVHS